MFKVRLLRFVGIAIFIIAALGALVAFGYFCYIFVVNFKNLPDQKNVNSLTALATVFSAMTAVAFFLYSLRLKNIDRAHKLCEEFEGSDYRQARRLLRALREPSENGEISNDILRKLLNNNWNDEEIKKLRDKYNLTENYSCFQESLIFTFNYWERMYIEIVRGHSNEWYLREQLFEIFISQYDRFLFWLEEYVKTNSPSQYRRLGYFYLYAKQVTNNSNLTLSQKIRKWWCAV